MISSILFVIFYLLYFSYLWAVLFLVFYLLYIFIPLGDLIPSILFMLCFSYFYLFGDVWLHYSIVSYEEYYADW